MALNQMQDADPYQLMRQANDFDYGTAQRADLLDRAIAAADRSGAVRAQFDTRHERMTHAVFSGEAELVLALFAWCQRAIDDRPDVIPSSALLWNCKFALLIIPKFARVKQQQIDAIVADMTKRYEANGCSLRPIYTTRAQVAMCQGKIEQARELWDEAMRHPRDRYADCRACELDAAATLLILEKRYDDMLTATAPIVARSLECAEVPHRTLPSVMTALMAVGRIEEARKLRIESYRLIRGNADFVEEVAKHVEFLVSDGDIPTAAELASRHVSWLQIATNDMMQERYARAVHKLLLAIKGTPGRESKWRTQLFDGLDATYGPFPENADSAGKLDILISGARRIGLGRAAALDERNGNRYYQSQWAQ